MKTLIVLVLIWGVAQIAIAQNRRPLITNTRSIIGILQHITAQDLKGVLAKEPTALYLDVRAEWERRDNGAVPGSLSIDYNSDSFTTELEKLDKTRTYIVYCHAGGRSNQAGQYMVRNGFRKVYNVTDGILGLRRAGVALGEAKKPTEKY